MPAHSVLLRVLESDVTVLRFAALVTAMLIYALFGSPTPNDPSAIEIAVAALLLVAVGASSIVSAFTFNAHAPLWRIAGQALLIYGLTIPLIAGALAGNDLRLALRDIIPFLFLLLPLFVADIFQKRPDYFPKLVLAFGAAGFLFSLRGLAEIHAINLPLPGAGGELFYLANAPSVLFAALWIAGSGGRMFTERPSGERLIILGAAALLSAIPLLAMSWTLQRAGIGAIAVYFLVLGMAGLWRYPYRVMFLGLIAFIIAAPFAREIINVAEILLHKTAMHGLNMRSEEMAAVWREAGNSPMTFLFGQGWGGTFESPAVAGIRVNYTHSLLTATILKTGLAGLLFMLAYLWGLFRMVLKHISRDMVLGLALAAPFLIDVFLYAAYKSLDFGLLLLVIAALS